jgi:FdhD protein
MSERVLRAGISRVRCLSTASEGALSEREDEVAVEEPLEIRLAGETFAVTMRTPGSDPELVAGFLFAEGLIASRADLGGISHCGKPGQEGYGNVIDVSAAPGSAFDPERARSARRDLPTSSACGVCGRLTVDDLLARAGVIDDPTRFDPLLLGHLPERLRAGQPNFERTGGLHAAAVSDAEGRLAHVREDVGRHNAVDKTIGRHLLDGTFPLSGRLLVVSGRTSFEIVQKAVCARLAGVVGVSAPSSLAVETAQRFGLLLIGFARGGTYNVYSGAHRLAETRAL